MPVYDNQDTKKEQGSHDDLGVHPEQREAEIANLERNYNSESANEPDYGQTPSRDDLDKGEQSTPDDDFGYSDNDKGSRTTRIGNRLWGTRRRKQGLAGGIVGLLALGGGFGFFSIASGPLQFMQISQLLKSSHFGAQEQASDGRLSRYMRYSATGGKGETRLGNIASTYHSRIDAKLRAAGITMEYGGAGGKLSSVHIDTSNPKSGFYGMSDEEMSKKGFTPVSPGSKTYSSNPDSWLKERAAQKAALTGIKGNMVTTAVRMRVFSKFGLADFHPLTAIKRSANSTTESIKSSLKDKWKKIYNGTSGNTIAMSADTKPDKDGKISTAASAEVTAAQEVAQEAIDNATGLADKLADAGSIGDGALRVGQGLLGPIAAAQSIVCPFVAVNEGVKDARYAMIILPLLRAGMETIIVGEQIKTGQDVDMSELQYLSNNFNQLDTDGSVTGKPGSLLNNWSDAKSIRAKQGLTGGVDALELNGTNSLLKGDGSVPALAWTNGFKKECSTAAQIGGGVASLGITILTFGSADAASAGVTLTARQSIKLFVQNLSKGGVSASIKRGLVSAGKMGAIYYATDRGVDLLINFLKGDALQIASGAEWGEDVDYGAALAANASNLALGGTKLTSSQVAALQSDTNQDQNYLFSQESAFARIFNTHDYRSLISRIASNFRPSFLQNISSVTDYLTNSISTIFKAVSSILSPVRADNNPQPYDYGFPIYGFSKEDLNDPAIQDPLQNADYVGSKLLSTCINDDGSIDTGCKYISEAKKCFSVDINQTTNSGSSQKLWDVIPTSQGAGGGFDPYNSDNYDPDECANPPKINSSDWLKLRFFIFDTGVVEGYACGEFQDPISCSNSGVSS